MKADPLVEGVTGAVIGVTDPARHLALFGDRLKFSVVAGGAVPARTAHALWGTGPDDLPVTVLAAAGAPGGRIVLLTVPAAIRDTDSAEYPHVADVGLSGVDVYTRDIAATHRELTAAGHGWLAAPSSYQVPLGEQEVTVTEGVCRAPDGTDLVFVQPAAPRGTAAWDADPHRPYTELTSVVCHVPDVDAEVAFWGPDGLGLDLWYDVTFSSPGLEAMADLPAGTRMRLAFLAGARTARIEVTHIADNPGGVDRRDRQRPGRSLGHSGWLVRTGDLDAALERATDRRGTVLAGPVDTDDPLLDTGRAAVVDTPNRIAVTLYQTGSRTGR